MELILLCVLVGYICSLFQPEQERKAMEKKRQEMTQLHAYDVLL